jgi:hypothetical protein
MIKGQKRQGLGGSGLKDRIEEEDQWTTKTKSGDRITGTGSWNRIRG